MSEVKKSSEIRFNVQLDETRLPVAIDWFATDSGFGDNKSCKALMVSLFDEKEKNTLKIDLWTKDMLVDEMKQFFAETFSAMSETYFNATGEQDVADSIKAFAHEFAEKTGVISKD